MIHKHFKTKAKFNEELQASRIADSDICFIKDTGEIWTHGKFYSKVESSETNGNIKINGTETTVYTHPTTTATTAAAVKVGKDSTGHVVLGAALTASDVGAAASSHGTHVTSDTVKTALGTGTNDNTYLRKDGQWGTPAGTQSNYGNITTSGTITSTEVTSATGVLVYDSNGNIQRATAAQTRSIIGAGTSNFSGSYSNLTNKPTLGTAAAKNATTTISSGSADLITSGAVYAMCGNIESLLASI